MVKIISDSTCDLSKELIGRYDITIAPLHVHLGEEEYQDGKDITPEEIFKWSDENKTTPKTSAASVPEIVELFKPLLEKYEELVCFSISDQMSAMGNVMRMAAEELGAKHRVSVVDSANLSTGVGLLVIEAAIMAKQEKCAEEIVAKMSELKPKVRASFVVDTLTYLHRGGRCTGVAALAGAVLKIHPMITVENGKMDVFKKYRGTLKNVIQNYAKDLEPALKKAKQDRVFITHSGCEREIVEMVQEYLKSLGIFEEVLETRAGGVVSSHCGPGTLGVLFIAGEDGA